MKVLLNWRLIFFFLFAPELICVYAVIFDEYRRKNVVVPILWTLQGYIVACFSFSICPFFMLFTSESEA